MSTSFHEWAAADTDPTTLRRVDQARTDFALIESNLEFIASQLAKQPTRGDLAKTALGIIFCSAVLTTLFVWIAWRRPATRAGAIIAVAIALACAGPLTAKEYRSREVAREFQREHPCPSTGLPSGGCPLLAITRPAISSVLSSSPAAVRSTPRQSRDSSFLAK